MDTNIDIDINIDIDNIDTDASTVNSVHACLWMHSRGTSDRYSFHWIGP